MQTTHWLQAFAAAAMLIAVPQAGGGVADPFLLADIDTGSTRFTYSNEVTLVNLPVPEGYDRFQITEHDDPSALGPWKPLQEIPATVGITPPEAEGPARLYAWFTNETAAVTLLRAEGAITYTSLAANPPVGDRYVAEGNLFAEWPYDTWAKAAATLQEVIATPDPDMTIWIAPGRYRRTGSDAVLYIHRVGGISYTFKGFGGPERVIIDGEGARRGIYLYTAANQTYHYAGFTVTNGYDVGQGGGIYLHGFQASSITVANLVVAGNKADELAGGASAGRGGGGIGVLASTSELHWTVRDSTFVGNVAAHQGSAIYGGIDSFGGTALIENCRFTDNTSTVGNAPGGAIALRGASPNSVIRGCLIEGTTGGQGVGLNVHSTAVRVENCIIRHNTAAQWGGGIGLYSTGTQVPTFRNVLIHGNIATSYGSGIGAGTGDNAILENCTIVDNVGGRWARQESVRMPNPDPERTLFRNVIIDRNIRTEIGGLNNLSFGTGNAPILHSCITGDVTLDGTSGPLPEENGNINVSPEFVDADGMDYRLASGSPCINTGMNMPWMDDAVDIAKNPRIDRVHNQVDMGAFEFQFGGTIILLR